MKENSCVVGISKELEKISFKALLARNKSISNVRVHGKQNGWFMNKEKLEKQKFKPKTQLEAFQKAMKWLFLLGQSVGLNPTAGVSEKDVYKMRFSVFSWKYLYCIAICLVQAIGAFLAMFYWIKNSKSTGATGNLTFQVTTSINTFLFLQIGTKWPGLMRELENSSLNEYIDRSLKFKCYTVCVVVWIMSLVEHALYIIANFIAVGNCPSFSDTYAVLLNRTHLWFYELKIPNNIAMGVFLQTKGVIATINWNFSDVYIMCISMYLVSILEQINKKIVLASEEHYLPPTYWRSLREDYNRATRLVRSFDGVISCVVFISFTNNLFFICLQLFNILTFRKVNVSYYEGACQNSSSEKSAGLEFISYLVFSTFYLVIRSFFMSLIAAGVNSTSLSPITALYNVPSSSYCQEVARFINQVHANTVSLSGMRFFHITRELVLTVAGTIVTYELVLLQVGE